MTRRVRRRLGTWAAATIAAATLLAVACRDQAPPTTGSIVIALVTPVPPSAGSAAAGPSLSRWGPAFSATEAQFTSVRVTLAGPTNRAVDLTQSGANWTATIADLEPGTYTVTVEGLDGSDLTYFGTTSNVTVVAGETRTASVPFATTRPTVTAPPSPTNALRFPVTFSSISGGTEYVVEWSLDPGFAGAQQATVTASPALVSVTALGTYNIRARAKLGARTGGPSDPVTAQVVADRDSTGSSAGTAAPLGFGNAVTQTLSRLNIVPASDEDWFTFSACALDTIRVETVASRLTPVSPLDTRLRLFANNGVTVLATDDNGGGGTDSRIEHVLPADDQFRIQVTGTTGTVGHYELRLTLAGGPNLAGTACVVPIDTIVVSPPAATLRALNATRTLTAVALAANGDTIPGVAVTWSSSNPAVATVSALGVVTAVGNGTATITASPPAEPAEQADDRPRPRDEDGSDALDSTDTNLRRAVGAAATGSAAITVAQAPATMSATPPADTIRFITGTKQLAAQVFDSLGSVIVGSAITWSTLDTTVVTVNAAGLVTATGAGNGTVTASFDTVRKTVAMSVIQTPVSLILSGGDAQTGLASRALPTPLAVRATDAAGYGVPAARVAWAVTSGGGSLSADTTTTNPAGATTNQWTLGPGGGAQAARASLPNIDTVPFTATATLIDTIVVSPPVATLRALNATRMLSAVALGGGDTVPNTPVIWSTSDGTVATVDTSGVVTAVGNGTATITATATAAAGSALITVAQAPASMNVTPAADTIRSITGTAQLVAQVRDSLGSPITGAVAVWSAQNTGIATVDAAGLVTAVGVGDATILASFDTVQATVIVSVIQTPTSIVLSGGDAQSGFAAQTLPTLLTVQVQDAAGYGVPGTRVAWTVTSGGGSLVADTTTTDPAGATTNQWTLGPGAGAQSVEASLPDLDTVPFTATAIVGVRWINAAGGNWSNPANWSTNAVPTSSDTVLIAEPGDYTVNIDVDAAVARLTLGEGLGTATRQTLLLSASALDVTNGLIVVQGGQLALGANTLNVDSLLITPGGEAYADGGSVNASSIVTAGTFRISPNGASVVTTGGFLNLGGVVVEDGGYLTLTGPWSQTAGASIALGAGATLDLSATADFLGSLTIDSASTVLAQSMTLTVTDVLTVATDGVLALTNSTAIADSVHNAGSLTLDASTISGPVHNAGYLAVTSGGGNQLSGALTTAPGSALEVSGIGTILTVSGFTNTGTLTLTGTPGPVGDVRLEVTGGETLINDGTIDFTMVPATIALTALINNGNIGADSTTGCCAVVSGSVTNSASGLLGLTAGQMKWGGGTNAGLVSLTSNSVLEILSSAFTNTGRITGTGTLSTAGSLTSTGVIDPGEDGAYGTLTIGGKLRLDAGSLVRFALMGATPGTNMDRLVVTDSLLLGGALEGLPDAGFDYTYGNQYPIITFGTLGRSWSDYSRLQLGGAYAFIDGYQTNNIVLLLTVPQVVITPAAHFLTALGSTVQLAAQAQELDGTPIPGPTFSWFSAGSGVTVSPTGLVTAVAPGTTIVYAQTVGARVGTAAITVLTAPVSRVDVEPLGPTIDGLGATFQLTVSVIDSAGDTVAAPVTWRSHNTGVLTVDQTGLITTVGPGQTVVEAEADTAIGYATVTVVAPGLPRVTVFDNEGSPTGQLLRDIWGANTSDVYAVGAGGAVAHYNGTGWSLVNIGAGATDLNVVWGTSGSDVWVGASQGDVFHFDGSVWSTIAPTQTGGAVSGIWAASPRDVWLALQGGNVAHWNGSTWTITNTGTTANLLSVWGSSAVDVFAVGNAGTIVHYDGATWTPMTSGTTQSIRDLWGAAGDDLWAVSFADTLLHYDGISWSITTTGTAANFRRVFGFDRAHIYAAASLPSYQSVWRYDGATWSEIGRITGVGVMAGVVATPNPSLVVATQNTLFRGHLGGTLSAAPARLSPLVGVGDTVTILASPLGGLGAPLNNVSVTFTSLNGTATVNASTGLVTAQFGGSVQIAVTAFGGAADTVNILVQIPTTVRVTPSGAGLVGIGTTAGLGATVYDQFDNPISGLTITWASQNPNVATVNAGGTVTAAGIGQAAIRASAAGVRGHALVTTAVPGLTPVNVLQPIDGGVGVTIRAIWGTAGNNLYAVGDAGTVRRWNGTTWSDAGAGIGASNNVTSVWGSGPNDVWVGGGQALARFNGTTWNFQFGAAQTIEDVWLAGPDQVFVSMTAPDNIVRYNGVVWDTIFANSPSPAFLWGRSQDQVYSGTGPLVVEYTGSTWDTVISFNPYAIRAGWGTVDPQLWIAAASGFVGYALGGGAWDLATTGSFDAYGITGAAGDEVWFAGSSLTGPDFYSIARWDGDTLVTVPVYQGQMNAAFMAPNGDLWLGGSGGLILRGHRGGSVTAMVARDTLVSVGDTVTVTTVARDASSAVLPLVQFIFTSSDPTVATVDVAGIISAVRSGATTIIATAAGGAADTITIVVALPAASVAITPAGAVLSGAGSQIVLAPAVLDVLGDTLNTIGITWTTANPAVATVSGDTVTAVGPGQTFVRALADTALGHATVTVTEPSLPLAGVWSYSFTSHEMQALWAASDTAVWSVANDGGVLRWNGGIPALVDIGAGSLDLTAIGGSGPNDIYIGTSTGEVFHIDGSSWAQLPAQAGGAVADIWAGSPRDVWIVLAGGGASRWNGAAWEAMSTSTSEDLLAIWGSASDRVFAAGRGGALVFWDGSGWSSQASGTSSDIHDLWGAAGNRVWGVTSADTILYFDGASWTPTSTGTGTAFHAVTGLHEADVYISGDDAGQGRVWHWNGSAWSELIPATHGFNPGDLFTLAASRTTVFAATAGVGIGVMNRGHLGGYVQLTPDTVLLGDTVTPNVVAFTGAGVPLGIPPTLFHWTSLDPAIASVTINTGVVTGLAGGTARIVAMAIGGAADTADVLVVQVPGSMAVNPDGIVLSGTGSTGPLDIVVLDLVGDTIFGIAAGAWATGNPVVATVGTDGVVTAQGPGQTWIRAQYDTFTAYATITVLQPGIGAPNLWTSGTISANNLRNVWAAGPTDFWIVGGNSTVLNRDGATFAPVDIGAAPGLDFTALGGSGPNDIYVAAWTGETFHFDGASWSQLPTPPVVNANAVWVASPRDVWFVHFNGETTRWNGTSWDEFATGSSDELLTVWGTSASDIFAGGRNGSIIHWDGTSWSVQTSGVSGDVLALWGAGSSDVWAGVLSDTLTHYTGSWNPVQVLGGYFSALSGLAANDVYAAGSNGPGVWRYDGSWTRIADFSGTGIGVIQNLEATDALVVGATFTGQAVLGLRGATVTAAAARDTLIGVGDTVSVLATARDALAAPVTPATWTFTSLDGAVATVDAAGLVTSVGQGTALIVATATGGAADTATILVQIPAAIAVTPPGGSISDAGLTTQFTATILDEDGNAIVGLVPTGWSTHNPNIATIDGNGLATSLTAGQTVVQASYNALVGHGVLTTAVLGATPVNLFGEMVNPTLGSGQIWRVRNTGNGDEAWAFGEMGAIRFDGVNWVNMNRPGTRWFFGGWVGAPDNVWATTDGGMLYHWNGSMWDSVATGAPFISLYAVWASSPTDIWAAGDGPDIHHYDGATWKAISLPGNSYIWDIWGTDSANVFAAGGQNTIFRFDGTSWNADAGSLPYYRGLWGPGGDTVFAAAEAAPGASLRSGGAWSTVTAPFTSAMYGVWGSAADDAYLAGQNGEIGRFDGSVWDSMPRFAVGDLIWGVAGSPDGNVYAVTSQGRIYRGVRGGTVAFTSLPDSIFPGDTVRADVLTTLDGLGGVVDSVRYYWTSSDPALVSSFTNGLVALDTGTVQIIVTAAGGAADTANLRVAPKAAAYVRSAVSAPWGVATNEDAMNQAFGVGAWDDLRYETVNVNALFRHYRMLYLEGSDVNADVLEAFIAANQPALEAFVTNGGRALINAAPNVGDGMAFGFGIDLVFDGGSGFVVAANVGHPIFVATVDTAFTGGNFSHASVSGAGISPIIRDAFNSSHVTLAEMTVGGGLVLFGGMTTDNFHSPQPAAHTLRINILRYTAGLALPAPPPAGAAVTAGDPSTPGTPIRRSSRSSVPER